MLFEQITEAVAHIRQKTDFEPEIGLILGTGLGALADEIDLVAEIDYAEIPHFPTSTVASHRGKLLFGFLEKRPVVVMAGRFHFYEGWSMQQVVFPIRVMHFLGIKQLWATNVSGSTNADFLPGDLIFINDHINLQPENPLRGPNDERIGPRFPDMLETYDKALIINGLEISKNENIRATTGVYVALAGPNLETPAEYNFIHKIGGDCVGMSTVPEVLAARHMGLRVLVISMISNACFPIERIQKTTLESVIAVAEKAEPKLRLVIKKLLAARV